MLELLRKTRFFLTGDGHRHPPFTWITACPTVEKQFVELMGRGLLCAHVEEHQEAVKVDSVPVVLAPLYAQQRIFGWEPGVYRALGSALQRINEWRAMFASGEPIGDLAKQAVFLDREINQVHHGLWELRHTDLNDQWEMSLSYTQYFKRVQKGKSEPDRLERDPAMERQYLNFLNDYQQTAMNLRTRINDVIGNNIKRKIDDYPGCTHLITCGENHLVENPLERHIQLPEGAMGVVDANKSAYVPEKKSAVSAAVKV